MRKSLRIIPAGALVCLALTGCGAEKMTEGFKDAPRTGNTNSAPADTITMPDGFSNVASKCDGPNRLYVLFHGDSPYGGIFVVPNDPRCAN